MIRGKLGRLRCHGRDLEAPFPIGAGGDGLRSHPLVRHGSHEDRCAFDRVAPGIGDEPFHGAARLEEDYDFGLGFAGTPAAAVARAGYESRFRVAARARDYRHRTDRGAAHSKAARRFRVPRELIPMPWLESRQLPFELSDLELGDRIRCPRIAHDARHESRRFQDEIDAGGARRDIRAPLRGEVRVDDLHRVIPRHEPR